jgi:alpha-D-ribose 1-methylphosphonate 5-triphosphate synthase subunit PhnL
MVLSLALDGHEPHTAVRFSRNTIGTGSFLRVFQRMETIDMLARMVQPSSPRRSGESSAHLTAERF